MRNVLLLAVLAATPLSSAYSQVIDPPNPAGQNELEAALVRSLEEKDLNKYQSLLANDIIVSQDGKIIAQNRAAWLRIFGEKLTAKGVSFKVAGRYSSSGRILLIQYFNSVASWGGDAPAECCWSYDAVAYDYEGSKVTKIQILRGGDRTPN